MMPADSDPRRHGIFWVFHLDWPTPPGLAPRLPASFVRLGPEAAEPLAQTMRLADPAEVLRRFEAGGVVMPRRSRERSPLTVG